MPNDPTAFTDREKFILGYYRAASLSDPRRWTHWDLAFVLGSIAAVLLFVAGGDLAYGFVGYALALGRLIHLVVEGRRWGADVRGIVTKYDAQLEALTQALAAKSPPVRGDPT